MVARAHPGNRPRRRFFDVRSGEGRDAALACGALFLFMLGHGVLETARDALFLSRLPPERLPYVYMVMAAAGLAVAWMAARAVGLRAGPKRLAAILGVGAAISTLLALLVFSGHAVAPYVVYVWVGLLATAGTVELWQLLGDRFTIEQAKRLFGLVGAGGVLGVAAGSGLASVLAEHLRSAGLILVGAAWLAAAAVVPMLMRPPPEPSRTAPSVPPVPPLDVVREEPHARRLLYLAFAATVTLTLADYLFKSGVAAHVAREDLGVFFGRFYAAVNAAALVVQVGATAWILRTLGAVRGLALLPIAMLAGASSFAALPALGLVVAMKAFDGTMRHSLQRIGLEVLFLPLPDAARRSLKGVVEAVGQRGGQAFASAGILLALALDAGTRALGIALAVLAALWLVGLVGTRQEYLELFRRRLRAGAVDMTAPLPEVDLAALEVLLVSLNSVEAGEAIAALTLLEQQGKSHLVPPLLMYHPSREVALRALELVARQRRRDVLPLVERLLESDDAERRAAALRAHHAIAPERGALEAHLVDDSPRVQTMALVASAADERRWSELAARAERIVARGSHASRTALARSIAEDPHPRWAPTLVALAERGDVAVRAQVAAAAARLRSSELVGVLVEMLASRALRDGARDALAAIGDDALVHLGSALADPKTPRELRRHIPRTLVRFPGTRSAAILVDRLALEPDGMTRYKILRALGSLHVELPHVPLDRRRLRERARDTLDRIIQLLSYRVPLAEQPEPRSPALDLLVALLREKEKHAIERLFRLLGLLSHPKDVELVYAGLQRSDPKVRAASLEVLANTVERELGEELLILMDDVSDVEKLYRLRGPRAVERPSRVVQQLRSDRSHAVRMLARHHDRERSARATEVTHARA